MGLEAPTARTMKPSSASNAIILLVTALSQYVRGQTIAISRSSELTFLIGTQTNGLTRATGPPTGPYQSYASKITITATRSSPTTIPVTFSLDALTGFTGSSSSPSSTIITGQDQTQTSTAPLPVNTQPCNGHVEFCNRRYSDVTVVGCHNSPFVRPGNSASNQALDVKTQLDDGVRFLQAQIQWPLGSSEPHFCHTSCDLLDAGPIDDWLGQVADWVGQHPYDVVTILLGNGNYSAPELYLPFIEKSGILKYTYDAPFLPMSLDDWPTLEKMIIHGKRVVMFLDYKADQKKYPWLLDEFSQMWETPFDPLDRAFPCSVQRPPGLGEDAARDRMYLMNHNLNAEFDVFGLQLLVPAVSLLNETNAAEGYGSVGLAANNCMIEWGRPPHVLNVDYYNFGSPEGSVFEAAARVNNVTYNGHCCRKMSGAVSLGDAASWVLLGTVAFSVSLLLA